MQAWREISGENEENERQLSHLSAISMSQSINLYLCSANGVTPKYRLQPCITVKLQNLATSLLGHRNAKSLQCGDGAYTSQHQQGFYFCKVGGQGPRWQIRVFGAEIILVVEETLGKQSQRNPEALRPL